MKKNLAIAAAVAALAMAGGAHAATLVWNFSSHTGDLGTTETYTAGGLSVTASGFNQYGSATDLWGKHNGGDENGLGMVNDPSGDHEIYYHKGFVQLDVTNLLGKILAGSLQFGTNSTTGGEAWAVYGSNTAGGYSTSNLVTSGSNEGEHKLGGSWKYYDFVETSSLGGKNFLITDLEAAPGVPEPATWAMMMIGVGMVGGSLRRRQAATFA